MTAVGYINARLKIVIDIHVGGGNLVGQKKVIFPEYLRAAIERTDS